MFGPKIQDMSNEQFISVLNHIINLFNNREFKTLQGYMPMDDIRIDSVTIVPDNPKKINDKSIISGEFKKPMVELFFKDSLLQIRINQQFPNGVININFGPKRRRIEMKNNNTLKMKLFDNNQEYFLHFPH